MKKKIIYGIMVIMLIVSIPLSISLGFKMTKLLFDGSERYQLIKYSSDNSKAIRVLRMDTHTGEVDYGYILNDKVDWTKLEDVSD